MNELRPRPHQGPLGIQRRTRLEFRDGELAVIDVRGQSTTLPDARVLVPYSGQGRQPMRGLLVLDDAGRVMVGMDADFNPYEVAAFAKQCGLNMRMQDLSSRDELKERFRPAPGFKVVDAYSARVLWELVALIALAALGVWAGRLVAIAIAPYVGLSSGAAQIPLEVVCMGLGLLGALKVGPLTAALWRRVRGSKR